MKKWFLILNTCYISGIVIWLISICFSISWQIDFAWNFVGNKIVNLFLMAISGIVMIFISSKLLSKYFEGKKLAPLLLGCFNLIYSISIIIEAFGNIAHYGLLNTGIERLIYVLINYALVFFFLFLQEIFSGSIKREKHAASQNFFIILSSLGFFLIAISVFPEIPTIVDTLGLVILLFLFMIVNIWQIRSSSLLIKKTDEERIKKGLRMIAISGVMYISILVMIGIKSATEEESLYVIFDILVPVLVLCTSIVTYMGIIMPSRKQS